MQRLLKDNKENLPVSTTWQFTLSRHLGFHLSQQNKRYIGTFKYKIFTLNDLQFTAPENTITYHNAVCLLPQNFA